MEGFLLVPLGAVVGANARYWVGEWASQRWVTSFPHGTLLINLSGSLLVGFLLALSIVHLLADPRWRIMLIGGFLGAYTTFSAYTYESVNAHPHIKRSQAIARSSLSRSPLPALPGDLQIPG